MNDVLALLEEVNPNALRLARFASLAARIEPELLRALRIELCDDADVSAEADLWWSDAMESRSPVAVRLSPASLRELRKQLFDDRVVVPAERPRARAVIQRIHAAEPNLVALEESLVYDALAGTAPEALEARLRPLLGTLLDDPKRCRELASWVLGAWPRLPESVRALPIFWSVLFAASAQGRGTPNTLEAPPELFAGGLEALPRLSRAGWVEIEAKLAGESLTLRRGRPVAKDTGGLLAPNLEPVLLEVRGSESRAVVALRNDEWSQPIRVNELVVTIRAIDGRTHELRVEAAGAHEDVQVGSDVPMAEVMRDHTSIGLAYMIDADLLATDGTAVRQDEVLEVHNDGGGARAEVVHADRGVAILRFVEDGRGPGARHLLDPTLHGPSEELRSRLSTAEPRRDPGERLRILFTNQEHAGLTWVLDDEMLVARSDGPLHGVGGAPVLRGRTVEYQVARTRGTLVELIPGRTVAAVLGESERWVHVLRCADRFQAVLDGRRERSQDEIADLREAVYAELSFALNADDVRRLWRSERAGRRWLAMGCIRRGVMRECLDLVLEAIHDSRTLYEREDALAAQRAIYDSDRKAAAAPNEERAADAPWRGILGPFPWKLWRPGSVLRVRFLDGSSELRRRVLQVASEWSEYANLRFELATNTERASDVRISFSEPGSWSYHGTDCKSVTENAPTMNLAVRLDDAEEIRRAVLHEFAHVLGFVNETQNPNARIPWDAEAVYADFSGPPNHWSREDVDRNVLGTYAASPELAYRDFDTESIMLHPIAAHHTRGRLETKQNSTLSASDVAFARTLYPREGSYPLAEQRSGTTDSAERLPRERSGIEVLERRLNRSDIPSRDPDQRLVAVWNLVNFGQGALRAETRALIATVLKRFDLTIIRRVYDPRAMKQVMTELGPSWSTINGAPRKDATGPYHPTVVFDTRSLTFRPGLEPDRIAAVATSGLLDPCVLGQFAAEELCFTVVTLNPPPTQDERLLAALAHEIPLLHAAVPKPNAFTLVTGLLGITGPTSPELSALRHADVNIPYALTRQGESPALDQILIHPRTAHFRDYAGLVDLYQESPTALFPGLGLTNEQAIAELSVGSPAWTKFEPSRTRQL